MDGRTVQMFVAAASLWKPALGEHCSLESRASSPEIRRDTRYLRHYRMEELTQAANDFPWFSSVFGECSMFMSDQC